MSETHHLIFRIHLISAKLLNYYTGVFDFLQWISLQIEIIIYVVDFQFEDSLLGIMNIHQVQACHYFKPAENCP